MIDDNIIYEDWRSQRTNWTIYTSNFSHAFSKDLPAAFKYFSNLDRNDGGGLCDNYIIPTSTNDLENTNICCPYDPAEEGGSLDRYCTSNILDINLCDQSNKDVCYYDLSWIFYQNDIIERTIIDDYGTGLFVETGTSDTTNYAIGDYCYNYWYDFCESNIVGEWCNEIYQAPYQCTRSVHQSVFNITAVSFAQTELVLTILVVIVACLLKTCCKCEIDHSEQEVERLTNLLGHANNSTTGDGQPNTGQMTSNSTV